MAQSTDKAIESDMTMVVFPFMSLPLVVQDLVAEYIVDNLIPKTALNFSLASHHCLWLTDRAQPRVIVAKERVTFTHDAIDYTTDDSGHVESITEEFFTNNRASNYGEIFITTNDIAVDNFIAALPLLKSTFRFVSCLSIQIKVLSKEASDAMIELVTSLKNLQTLECLGRQWDNETSFPVVDFLKVMRKHTKFVFMRANDVDDDILRVLSSKTSSDNPLKSLSVFSRKNISAHGFDDFIKNTTFAPNSQISLFPLEMKREDVVRILSKYGKIVTSKQVSAICMQNEMTELMVCFLPSAIPQEPVIGLLQDLRNIFRRPQMLQ